MLTLINSAGNISSAKARYNPNCERQYPICDPLLQNKRGNCAEKKIDSVKYYSICIS